MAHGPLAMAYMGHAQVHWSWLCHLEVRGSAWEGMQVEALRSSLLLESVALQRYFGGLYESHFESLCDLMSKCLVPWAHAKESILTANAVCRSLLANVVGHKNSGPLACEGQAMMRVVKGLSCTPIDPQYTPLLVSPSVSAKVRYVMHNKIYGLHVDQM